VDLIAMTTHGRNACHKDPLGPTAQRLLHRTEVPLLLLRTPVPSMPIMAGYP
jgi:nucleotide-binding universal stress UspA family protein